MESQYNGPNQTQSQISISFKDVFGADTFEIVALLNKRQRDVEVFDLVNFEHLASIGLSELLAGDDFQEFDELQAVSKVLEQISDLKTMLDQERVAPFGEGLLLN